VAESRGQVAESGIRIEIEGEFADVAGDESLLSRVFLNLIRNAVEAIDGNAAEKRIRISGSADVTGNQRFAHVRFSDTGSGISNEDLPRIFIPFFTTKTRGYGIGLALVQKILVAHGGDVAVERSDATGTTFHCRIPLLLPVRDVERQS
jgi:signal transduction histidine kinase